MWYIKCTQCKNESKANATDYCDKCGNPLEAIFDYSSLNLNGLFDYRVSDMWKYRDFYPLQDNHPTLTLGEGGTPLVKSNRIGITNQMPDLWFKLDSHNPTGSFKDRAVVVGVARAIEQGALGIVCASSGNAAGSAVTYAARAGLTSIIFVPESTPSSKLSMVMAHGAHVYRVRGNYSDAFTMARRVAQQMGWVNVTTTYINPYAVEGNKSVAFELFEQLKTVPDWIVIPVSSGPLLYGVWKGYSELLQFGLVDRIPRLVAAQPEGCAPLSRAFIQNQDNVTPWKHPQTIASGLNDPLIGYEGDGTLTLQVLRRVGGISLAVPDHEILSSVHSLAKEEGIFSEPASATAVAVATKLRRMGTIAPHEKVVCLITGHGLKQPVFSEECEIPLISSMDEFYEKYYLAKAGDNNV